MLLINIDIRPDNMSKAFNISVSRWGFSLAEVLAALTIGAMILVAVLAIYGRVETAAAGITRKLDSSRQPFEVLQRIAEDLDSIVDGDADTRVTVENKFSERFQSAQLKIIRTISDSRDKPQPFEEIIWQTAYDYENDANGLVLYRSYKGIGFEDKLLDEQRKSWEKAYPFVPVCDGVTYFKVLVARGQSLSDEWTRAPLPYGVKIIISFAEPFEAPDGSLDVPETEKFIRTVGIGRTRKIAYKFVKKEYETEAEDEDVNVPGEDSETAGEGVEEAGEDEKDAADKE
jgi:hypothetical protein